MWAEDEVKRHGIHLRTGSVRGDEVRGVHKVYDTEFGFTLQLRLDGRGRHVAFAPCCRSSFPPLVVAGLADGTVREPLAAYPDIYAVGAIAWSLDSTRLAFEGFTEVDKKPSRGIYTVGVDGSGLETVLAPEAFGETSVSIETLVWPKEGILYTDARDLKLIAPGGSPTVQSRGVETVQLSGNGRWLFTVRSEVDGRSLWRSRTDGSEAERVRGLGSGVGVGGVFFPGIAPDRRGRRLLGVDLEPSTTLRMWKVGEPLAGSHVLRGVTGSPYVAAWY